MLRSASAPLVLIASIAAAAAWADRAALTIDLGVGGTATLLPAPVVGTFKLIQPTTTLTTAGAGYLGVRYALTHEVELSLGAFYEPSVTVFHNNIILESGAPPFSQYPGTLTHRLTRYGALAGARYLWGTVWRFYLGGELGWAYRSYTDLAHIDDRDPSAPTDYRLELPAMSIHSLVLSAGGGLEWAFADKMSVTVSPRLQLLLGRELTVAATLPVVFSFSWYL